LGFSALCTSSFLLSVRPSVAHAQSMSCAKITVTRAPPYVRHPCQWFSTVRVTRFVGDIFVFIILNSCSMHARTRTRARVHCLFNSRFCSQSMFVGQLKRISLKALRFVNTARLSLLVLQKRSRATSSAPSPPPSPATARAESADGNMSGIGEDEDAAWRRRGGRKRGGRGRGRNRGRRRGEG
jgi:hypothetical protein